VLLQHQAPSTASRTTPSTLSPITMAIAIQALFAALVVAVVYRLSRIGQRPKGYPPGPPTLPFIGNLHLIPKKKTHLQFKKWAEEYGPVYSLMLGTKTMVVLASDQAVKDLLDKRSGIYSSRPDHYLAQVASGGLRFALMVHKNNVLLHARHADTPSRTAIHGAWRVKLSTIIYTSMWQSPMHRIRISRAKLCL
jgi:hypothetical protein